MRYTAAFLFFTLATVVWFHDLVIHPGSRIACCIGDGRGHIRDYKIADSLHKGILSFTHDPFNGAPEGTDRTTDDPHRQLRPANPSSSALRGPLGVSSAATSISLLGLLGTAMALFWFLQRFGCTMVASLFGGYVVAFSPYAFEKAYAGWLALIQNWATVVVLCRRTCHARSPNLRERRDSRVTHRPRLLHFCLPGLIHLHRRARVPHCGALAGPNPRGTRPHTGSHFAHLRSGRTLPVADCYVYHRERSTVKIMSAHALDRSLLVFGPGSRILAAFSSEPARPLHPRDPSGLSERGDALFRVRNDGARDRGCAAFVPTRPLASPVTNAMVGCDLPGRACPAGVPALSPAHLPRRGSQIPTPSILLAGASSYIRDYARLGIVFGLAIAMLAAMALTALAQRPDRRWRLLAPFALVVAVIELLPGNVGTFNTSTRPGWVAWLAASPRGIVATYPMDLHRGPSLRLGETNGGTRFWTTTLVSSSFSSRTSEARTRQQAIRFVALDPTKAVTARVLATEGVRYVVISDDAYRAENRRPPILDRRYYTLEAHPGSFRIYSVHAPHVNLSAVLEAHEDEIVRLQALGTPIVVRRGEQLEVTNGDATLARLTGRASNSGRPRRLEITDSNGRILATALVPAGTSVLHVGPFAVPPHSRFALRSRPVPVQPSSSPPRARPVACVRESHRLAITWRSLRPNRSIGFGCSRRTDAVRRAERPSRRIGVRVS